MSEGVDSAPWAYLGLKEQVYRRLMSVNVLSYRGCAEHDWNSPKYTISSSATSVIHWDKSKEMFFPTQVSQVVPMVAHKVGSRPSCVQQADDGRLGCLRQNRFGSCFPINQTQGLFAGVVVKQWNLHCVECDNACRWQYRVALNTMFKCSVWVCSVGDSIG